MNRILFILLMFTTTLTFAQEVPDPETLKPGSKAPDFNLPGIDGKNYSLQSFSDAKILVFIFGATHCPTAQAYEDRIIKIQNDFKEKGLQVVMISPNAPYSVCLEENGYTDLGDTFEEMKIRAKDKGYNFPFLYDGDTEEMSIKYGPVATPHTFIFDQDRILRYVGRIDDSEKIGTEKIHDARNAIEAILAGKEVEVKQTKVFGCSIKWKWKDGYRKTLDEQWTKKEIPLNELSVAGLKELLKNDTENLLVINIWATWCGPCIAEMPAFVDTYRMFMGRDFDMVTISTDKLSIKDKVQKFLEEKNAALTNNYIYGDENKYDLIEAIDPEWQGQIPYTLFVEPGGKIYYRHSGGIMPLTLRKKIVDHPLIGRYF
ncbi:MAG: redoxin domain-containing protein [Mariniphaga sp.]|nr:redoxin domain-containing protein [Mariniphaga sp.]